MSLTAALTAIARRLGRRRVLDRWSKDFVEAPWMHQRVQVAASWIDASSRVLDLGCGRQLIRSYLPPDCAYTGADLEAMHRDNLILDLDTRFVLPGTYDTVLLLGVLEFLNHPLRALALLEGHCSRVILSYVARKGESREAMDERRKAGARNHWTEEELVRHLEEIGLVVERREVLWERETHRHLIARLRWLE